MGERYEKKYPECFRSGGGEQKLVPSWVEQRLGDQGTQMNKEEITVDGRGRLLPGQSELSSNVRSPKVQVAA